MKVVIVDEIPFELPTNLEIKVLFDQYVARVIDPAVEDLFQRGVRGPELPEFSAYLDQIGIRRAPYVEFFQYPELQ